MMTSKSVAGKAAAKRREPTPAAKRKLFLEYLSMSANITQSAQKAGIDRTTVYRWRAGLESFRTAWKQAMDQALDEIEALLLERAANGVEKPVFYGGKPCGTVRQYSDALAMFILRARRPEVYAKAVVSNETPDAREDDPVCARKAVHTRLGRLADQIAADDQTRDALENGEGT